MNVYTLNAFSDDMQGGNPAGVMLDAQGLSDEMMKAIAAKVGFSETAFVLPSENADFRVRFFTPKAEVDLCGHATIATFSLLAQLGQLSPGSYRQETLAGILSIDILDSKNVLMEQARPVFSEEISKSVIADSLNMSMEDFRSDLPCRIVSTGLRDVLVPVKDLKTLHAIQPDFDKVSQVSKAHDLIGYHLFCLETLNPDSTSHCRNLAPLYDIPEEAATGTSSGALACYLFHHGMLAVEQCKRLGFEQGYSMNRPSEIKAILGIQNHKIEKVQVGGRAVITGQLLVETAFRY